MGQSLGINGDVAVSRGGARRRNTGFRPAGTHDMIELEWARRKNMGLEKLKGRGRLVPTLATGLEYQVNYEIHFPILEREPMRQLTPNHMCSSKCFVRSACHHRIPDGPYFLHINVGQVHQVKSIDGKWHYL